MLSKRLIFLKTYVMLLSVFSNRHKTAVRRKAPEVTSLILRRLKEIETTTSCEDEFSSLLGEMLVVLNIDDVSVAAVKAFGKWVENKPGDGIVIRSLLKMSGAVIKNYEILVDFMEIVINNYFNHMGKIFICLF